MNLQQPLFGQKLIRAKAHARESMERVFRIRGGAGYLSKQDARELRHVTTIDERQEWTSVLTTAAQQIDAFLEGLDEVADLPPTEESARELAALQSAHEQPEEQTS